MAKVNFAEIMVENLQGEQVKYDVWLSLSNALYMQGANIVEHELGSKIYHCVDDQGHPAPVELTPDEVQIVLKFAQGFPFILQKALAAALTPAPKEAAAPTAQS